MKVVSPRTAALRILAARSAAFGSTINSSYALADFQQEGAARAARILQERGGVIIADSVGLGKTFMAAALIEQHLVPGSVALVIPAGLRPLWRSALRPLIDRSDSIRWVTHGQLSRSRSFDWSPALIVVDEAHAFRNPHTRRYRALRRLMGSAQVVLLTATPVNNSLSDLYFQLRLFATDDAFRDAGVASLAALLRNEEHDLRALKRLQNAIMVRRSRTDLRRRFKEIALPSGDRLRFPEAVELINVRHSPLVEAADVEGFFGEIRFACYGSESSRALISLSLLKRLQSGRDAALKSIDGLIDFHRRFLTALSEGRLLQARVIDRANVDQLWFSELILPAVPADVSSIELRSEVTSDLDHLEAFRQGLLARADTKLPALVALLTARPPPARTLVFSEFRDTAEHLWRELNGHFQVGLVTGGSAYLGRDRCSRRDVIRNFSPRSNGAPEPRSSARVDVLIATDVLAEGLNLQEADAVVSYDLPWNPVRLIQRAGRIDRIGSEHGRVFVYNFMPDRDLDAFLGLVRRLRRKLRDLRSAGQESAVLEPDELDSSFWSSLSAGDDRVLDHFRDDDPWAASDSPTAYDPQSEGEPCVSSTSRHPNRVLTCWKWKSTVRELIWDGKATMDDKAAATRILSGSVESEEIISAPLVEEGIAGCQAYLLSESRLPSTDPAITALSRTIQRSVMEYGLTTPRELAAAAESALQAITGCPDPRRAMGEIRAASTALKLLSALETIRQACRRTPVTEPPNWDLVAAIGSD